MRVLDLFAGACGGWSLGLHRAVADIIVGSPPCQDASTANAKGKGLDGERTGLFFEAVRLVLEVRPRWACLENVPGIRRRGIDRVLDRLEAGRYACWPLVVGAADLGANHLRKRLILVAADAHRGGIWEQPRRRGGTGGADSPVAGLDRAPDDAESDGNGWPQRRGRGRIGVDLPAPAPDRHMPRDASLARLAVGEGEPGDIGPELTAVERAIGRGWDHWNGGLASHLRVDDGLSDAVARACISAYGDSFCPQAAEIVGRAILAAEAA